MNHQEKETHTKAHHETHVKAHHESHEAKSSNNETIKLIVMGLVALSLVFTIYLAFFKKDAVWLETMKTGGPENFELVQQIYSNDNYKTQQSNAIKQALTQFGSQPDTQQPTAQQPTTDNSANNPTETTPALTMDKAKIEEILKGTYVKGKKNSRIVLIEYSDMLCPFCKRHYNDQTLEKVVDKYPNDVSLVFKNMPLVSLHPTAKVGAQGLECAGIVGGEDKYYEYMALAFQVQSFDTDVITKLAQQVGLNENKFNNCIVDTNTSSTIDAIIQEGNSVFGIQGTPGNVILNTESGKYVVIPGAYPFEKFDTEVANLLK